MENRVIYWTCIILILVQTCCCISRQLKATFLSSSEESCKNRQNTLLYIIAEGPNDSLNYLWNFIHNPSVLVALTNPSSELNITWSGDPFPLTPGENFECLPDKISFNDPDIFAYGMSIQKIYEFNDVEDTANINSSKNENINVLNPRYFVWYIRNKVINNEKVELEMVGHSYFDKEMNITRTGSITLLINVFGTHDRVSQKPSMLHSENSTQIDLSIDNFETNKTFSNSRFAVEVLFVSDGKPDVVIPVHVKQTVNDEHTPGVFKIVEINSPHVNDSETEGNMTMYLQWRPISYTTKEREVTDSSDAILYPLKKSTDAFLDITHSILFPYYQEQINGAIVRKLNVSLGTNGDGFYKKTQYNSWTFLIGYNNSLDERLSSGTIVIISNIIGLPLLMTILYGSVTYIRKTSARRMNSL